MSVASFFIGAIVVAYGVATIKYNYRYTNMFGRSPKIEAWFGSMYTFVLITSILACLIGLLAMAGLWDEFANLITKPFQGLFSA